MNYFPNSSARTLKTKRSYNLGVLLMDEDHNGFRHERFARVLDAFKVSAEKHGYDLTFIGSQGKMTFYEHARYRGVDGMLIACVNFHMPEVLELVHSQIPVVTIDYVFDNCIGVISDNIAGMRQLTDYAISQGHRRIAYVYGTRVKNDETQHESSVTTNRVNSFFCEMEKHGLQVPSEYLRPIRYRDTVRAEEETEKLLSLTHPPTCIFYSDDKAATGGIKAIRKAGLRIPEDISIAGYDGSELADLLSPSLTTVNQNDEQVGEMAAQLLIRSIETPQRILLETVVIPAKLVEGETIGKL